MTRVQPGKRYRIAYLNAKGEASTRVILVRTVTLGAYRRTYIRAFCELVGEERTFRLDRMQKVTLLNVAAEEAPAASGSSGCRAADRVSVIPVTTNRNSSYVSPRCHRIDGGQSRVADRERERINSAPASRRPRPHRFRRFLLNAAALFLLFDGVLTSDPGWMSRGILDQIEALIDPYPGLVRPEPEPEPDPLPPPQPEPQPDPQPSGVKDSLASALRATEGIAEEVPLREGAARRAIREARLFRSAGVTNELVISRFERADVDRDGELSWKELRRFQAEVYRSFRYESNATALRPEEFFVAGGGDCEDFAIFSAAMLAYWGWEAYVASLSTNPNDAHAVVFVRVKRVPSWASFYEVSAGPEDPRFAASGIFVPVDYDVVGGLSDAVTPGSTVTDIVVPTEWYGLAI